MESQVLFLCSFLFVLLGCNNDDDNTPEIDKLPPATQTGAGTFGCLVNGEAFVETGTYFNCFYQLIDGEYYFSISAENDDMEPCNIYLGSIALELNEDNTYLLTSVSEGNAGAGIFFCNELEDYETTSEYSGELTITKFDFENHIVSGTFNFTVLNTQTNKLYVITNGRFDTLFTQ